MTSPTPGRPTIVMKVVNTIVEDIVRVIMGLIVMAGGGWLVAYEAKHPPASNLLIIAGLVFAAMGFLMMPFVFEQFQRIIIVIFPGGVDLPVVGHLFRRKDDTKPAGS